MASPRITNTMRSDILRSVINDRFKAEQDALQKRSQDLGIRAYNEIYTKEQIELMKKLGKGFLRQCSYVLVSTKNGWSCRLGLEETQFTKEKLEYNSTPITCQKLSDEIELFLSDQEKLNDRIKNVRANLLSILESVQTFKKLRAVWPEGEKYYDMFDVDNTVSSNVPAPIISELNKELGL